MDDSITTQDLETTLRVLRIAANDVNQFDSQLEFKTLIAKINRLARQRNGREIRQLIQEEDNLTKNIALEMRETGVKHEAALVLHKPRNCYICKIPYHELQGQYHLLCEDCARINLEKRTQRSDLKNRVALITGGRIKIGFELALKLLRDGARVILTTRFPRDAEKRFATQADFLEWSHRLELHGLDLRHLASVQQFLTILLERESHLDILINNAAQTISRPLDFYAHLLEFEQRSDASALVRSPMQFVSHRSNLARFRITFQATNSILTDKHLMNAPAILGFKNYTMSQLEICSRFMW